MCTKVWIWFGFGLESAHNYVTFFQYLWKEEVVLNVVKDMEGMSRLERQRLDLQTQADVIVMELKMQHQAALEVCKEEVANMKVEINWTFENLKWLVAFSKWILRWTFLDCLTADYLANSSGIYDACVTYIVQLKMEESQAKMEAKYDKLQV